MFVVVTAAVVVDVAVVVVVVLVVALLNFAQLKFTFMTCELIK